MNQAPSTSKKQNKIVMFSELKKGTRFQNPVTGETCFVNYADDECLGIGPNSGYTTTYIRKSDELWSKPIDLNL